MTQMRDLGVVAFFGPDGTCHTEAKLAAAWNLPMISHKCAGAHGSFEKGSGLGATFARTLPPAYKASKSVVALLKAFGWSKFAIVAGDELTAAAQQLDAIKELAQSNGMVITAEHRFADYIPRLISDMERIVDQTYYKTRDHLDLGQNTSNDVLAFRAVLRLTPSFPTNPHYGMLCQMIKKMSAAPPFCVPNYYHKLFDDASA
ncbi:unnamed protein product [Spodoptera littoralis]|uniref:Receptor ligand binding region domain-containing protein n=1 Tax=Spodoptera littoralis TaxID=7109 RepID=A0A9P0N7Z0_SPOLI|nr:unnamed protein product [Spodoptera littoralis]CAH1645740.1 unnamed protein product [Spodoptera littoralis]